MTAISQKTFSSEFSWMKIHEISIKMSLKFIPNGPINNIQALFQIMAWRRLGDKRRRLGAKPLSEPIVAKIPDVYMRHSASMS